MIARSYHSTVLNFGDIGDQAVTAEYQYETSTGSDVLITAVTWNCINVLTDMTPDARQSITDEIYAGLSDAMADAMHSQRIAA